MSRTQHVENYGLIATSNNICRATGVVSVISSLDVGHSQRTFAGLHITCGANYRLCVTGRENRFTVEKPRDS